MVPLLVVAGGAWFYFSNAPMPLKSFRAQVRDVPLPEVVYIESATEPGGKTKFSNDPETIAACMEAVQSAIGASTDRKMTIPLFFYLKKKTGGIRHRRSLWISPRDTVERDFGPKMGACVDSFAKTAQAKPPAEASGG